MHAKSLHYTFDQKVPPVTVLHDLKNGTEKQILTEGRILPNRFDWTPDNSGFYFAAPFSNDPRFLTASIELLYFFDVNNGKRASAAGLGEWFRLGIWCRSMMALSGPGRRRTL